MEVVVGEEVDPIGNRPELLHGRAAQHRGARRDEARLGEEPLEELALRERVELVAVVEVAFAPLRREGDGAPVDHADRRVVHRHLELQLVGQPHVVGIEEREPLAARLAHGELARAPQRLRLRRAHVAHPRIGECRDDRGRGIRRGVVPDDQLPVAEGLGAHALQRLAKVRRSIGHVHDDAHARDARRAGRGAGGRASFGHGAA